MALEKEIATFNRLRDELAPHAGKFVLIHDDQLVDYFSSYDDAIKAGYKQFGLAPFLVKQIAVFEQVHVVTRLLYSQASVAGA